MRTQVIDRDSKASAHSGILGAAKGVVDDIVREGILAALMEGAPLPPLHRVAHDCRRTRLPLVLPCCTCHPLPQNSSRHACMRACPSWQGCITSPSTRFRQPWGCCQGRPCAGCRMRRGSASQGCMHADTRPGVYARRRNWSIVVTGHSLGAGAAALVALYIRSFYPNSRAWAFEPPGALCPPGRVLGMLWLVQGVHTCSSGIASPFRVTPDDGYL